MDLQTLQLILQCVSSVVVVFGVTFAALQFRHWRRVAHVGNFSKLVELQMHLREMRVADPSLAAVYRHDVIGLESEREIREYFFNLMQLSVYEIVWFSYHNGQLPRDYYISWEQRMRDIASEPTFRKMFASPSMKIMHNDFQKYVSDLMREVPERA